jgi:phytoene dehydrogenase-like protein
VQGALGAGSRTAEFDAVVVGAGPNGLVGALCLARAGRRVLLVEAAKRIGGALRTEELTLPGFRHDVGATVLPLTLASAAFRELALDAEEVRFLHPRLPAAHPLDGDAVLIDRDLDTTARGLGRDAAAWRRLIGATAAAGQPLIDALLSPLSPRQAAGALLPLARYGVSGVLPATVLARAAFREEPARAAFAGMAGHSVLSLRQPVTAGYATLLAALAHSVGWPVVQGGTEQLAIALGARLTALGGQIHVSTPVSDLRELPSAPIVLLDLSPGQVLALRGTGLPDRYRSRLARYRRGPGVFKVDWALDGAVPWRDERVAGAGTVHLGGALSEIAAAEREVSRGGHPERPYVICVQPSGADPSRAPEGNSTLWAYCHVPNGSTLDMTAAIEGQLERYAPGFTDRVLARHVYSPAQLQRFDANLVGGDLGGGAADLRQFVARPMLSPRPWATPVPGLFLCSASTPPGGGVHGMGGWQAARLALREDPAA